MGLIEFLKNKVFHKAPTGVYTPMNSGGEPFYKTFSDSLYASDIVLQSIRCKANEFKKLDPRHIRTTNGKQSVVTDSSIAHVLQRPNELMTMGELLEKITILLELNKNAFIYPAWYRTKGGEKYFTGLYPLKPSSAEYQMDANGEIQIHFTFVNAEDVTLPASDVIHWRKDYGVNTYFGGNNGNDSAGLLNTIQEYDKLCQSIAKAIECSCQINGVMKINSYMSDEKKEAERAAFNARLANNESGILFEDEKANYTHIPRDVKLVDAETLNFFYSNITRANGVSLPILNGDYNKSQKEAFYEHALEADIKTLGQAMSKVIFSDRETSFGNAIVLYPSDIAFMSMENKIAVLSAGLPAGLFTKNEARELLGYPPIEGGDVMPRGYNELDNGNGGAANGE